nr:hypothetical protein CFP56_66467 [Quercus suber]
MVGFQSNFQRGMMPWVKHNEEKRDFACHVGPLLFGPPKRGVPTILKRVRENQSFACLAVKVHESRGSVMDSNVIGSCIQKSTELRTFDYFEEMVSPGSSRG